MTSRSPRVVPLICLYALSLLGLLALGPPPVLAQGGGSEGPTLADELGRNDVRVLSAPFPVHPGATVSAMALPERLERLGYTRVRDRPDRPGEYFWGHEVFWIYRRAHRIGGDDYPAALFGLELDGGRVTGFRSSDGEALWPDGRRQPWLEPEVLAESLTGDRARTVRVDLDALPEHAWRTVLAAEDHRFFDHAGLDWRGIARALLRNAQAGEVTQGGSTITQQLVKMRDLTPRRTVGRKASEAVRALALEAEYDKREILASDLDHVYYGHVGGLNVHGLGTAARAFFGKPVERLDLGESAVLAAMVQSPNRMAPDRHPERVLERQRWVLSRMEELGWASPDEVARERRRGLPRLDLSPPSPPAARRYLSWLRAVAEEEAPGRFEEGRGFVVQTAIDPLAQEWAERAVAEGLDRLRRERPALRRQPLSAALVALDTRTGAVLAYVGGDPDDRADRFDRARLARRQAGSAVKPLTLLQAFDDCGAREPLAPASRVLDEPVTLELPSGPWTPANSGRRSRGVVDVRESLVSSLNVPFVRIARWCGFDEVAATFREAGVGLPDEAPPAFVLGAVETTPLEMAGAFTVFANLGLAVRPVPALSLSRPGGRGIERLEARGERVAEPAAAWLVRDLMADAVRRGTGRPAAIPGVEAWGKTGSSSDLRDAWFVGGAGSVVAAVWVGIDDGSPLGLSGSQAAAPIWRAFVTPTVAARPPLDQQTPDDVVVRWVQDSTGRLVEHRRRGAHSELFDRDHLPPERRLLRPDPPLPVVE
jgi:penicillin-binding protein 1B